MTKELLPKDLQPPHPLINYDFETTKDIGRLDYGVIGQDRAVQALTQGMRMSHQGYHISVSAGNGTGRHSLLENFVRQYAQRKETPKDLCFLWNMNDAQKPVAISLAAGQGKSLQADIQNLLTNIEARISGGKKASFYQRSLWKNVESKLQILSLTEQLFRDLKSRYQNFPAICLHLDNVQTSLSRYWGVFIDERDDLRMDAWKIRMKDILFRQWQVHLAVDHSETAGAPVILERHPSRDNLIGHICPQSSWEHLRADFHGIQPGSLIRAAGGFLLLEAKDILDNPHCWKELKTALQTKTAKMHAPSHTESYEKANHILSVTLPVETQVILVGHPDLLDRLCVEDEDFPHLFKMKAEFDTEFPKTDSSLHRYVLFLADQIRKHSLKPFHRDAIAEVIRISNRDVEHKDLLSAKFTDTVNVLKESDYWAKEDNSNFVGAAHVRKSVDQKIYRQNLWQKKLIEEIRDNKVYIETEGRCVGQINGMTVVDIGRYSFGFPVRITTKTYFGKGNIVNIEREVDLSGHIHSKGVLIMVGYLGDRFAQNKPLALSASICFEQQHDEIDGDSASSAEFYSLLSSLGNLPLKQEIAVTGSVDQMGHVLAVGGINEKIEGFFDVCRLKGLTGQQGIIIPSTNVQNLILAQRVVDAVSCGKFHIYAIERIEEGIEILTGLPAGDLGPDWTYPEGSIFYRVNKKLERYAELSKEFSESEID